MTYKSGIRRVAKHLSPLKVLVRALRIYRSFCYLQARILGDIIAILTGKFLRRVVRSKGLQITSRWSKHI